MAALTTLKEDLNEPIQSPYIGYYFPVSNRRIDTTEGAWLRSYKQEQKRRFKAIVCTNYKTLDEIRTEVHGTSGEVQQMETDHQTQEEQEEKRLNGFYLLNHCHAEDPSEVFSININDQGFSFASSEDFLLFDKVQCISARENRLGLEEFKTFSHLQELELPLNGINSLKLKYGDFPHLQHLDLSFNNLPGNCLKSLGLMPNLVTLNLSGNCISELPTDFAKCFRLSNSYLYLRFPRLRILKLDNNRLWHPETFVSLGALPHLEHLDLENNLLYHVPQLYTQNGKIGFLEELSHSPLEAEYSALDADEPGQALADKEHKKDDGNKENKENVNSEKEDTESPAMEPPPRIDKKETNEFLDSLLSDMNDIDEELFSDQSQEELLEPLRNLSDSNPSSARSSKQSSDRSIERSLVHVSTSIETQDSEGSYCYQTQPVRYYDESQQPFSRLLSLNMSNNRFSNEESLVAIAAWPTIRALVIHGNPLIKTTPIKKMTLLKAILIQKLGISVISKLPGTPSHHHTEMYPKYMRTVKENVRKLPKLTVDEILALDSSKPAPTSSTGRSLITPSERSTFSPVPTGPSCTGGHHSEKGDSYRTSPESSVHYDTGNTSEAYDADQEEGAFFMTQPSDETVPTLNEKTSPKQRKGQVITDVLRQQYGEYAALFDDDDEEDERNRSFVQPKKDIQSNVQALRYALDHQLTVLDQPRNLHIHNPQPSKHHPPIKAAEHTYEQTIAEVFENLKESSAVKEVSLADVFKEPEAHKKDHKEAKKLLREVESHYNQKSDAYSLKSKEKKKGKDA